MKIALLQTNIAWENKPVNLRHYEEMIRALPVGVRLVLLPEMFSTGFSMQPEKWAESTRGETLKWLCETAVQHSVAMTGSFMVEENGKYFNRLLFVFPDGSYKQYDKRHLFTTGGEHAHYTPGTQRLVVDYEGWRICPLVCYDLRFPVWSRNNNDAYDLLLYVANWPSARINAWNALLPARAIENQCYVAGVNRCGNDGAGVPHSGQSQVIDFKGRVVAAAGNFEKALTAVLSLDDLRAFRQKFPAGNDADSFTLQV
jgi:predicted amidohydrolase